MKIPNGVEQILGVDPDTKNQAFALLNLDGSIEKAWVAKSKNSNEITQGKAHFMGTMHTMTKPFFAIVEGQKLYLNDKKSNPDSMIKLARASGIACAWLSVNPHCKGIYIPTPSEWKGTAQKHAHQSHILRKLGQVPVIKGSGKGRYAVPEDNFLDLNLTEYKHVVDAIGLAQWALDKYLWELKKLKIKSKL